MALLPASPSVPTRPVLFASAGRGPSAASLVGGVEWSLPLSCRLSHFTVRMFLDSVGDTLVYISIEFILVCTFCVINYVIYHFNYQSFFLFMFSIPIIQLQLLKCGKSPLIG
jgi:hypothetical protein